MVDTTYRAAEAPETASATKLAGLKIGPLPLGIYLAAALVCAAAVYSGKLPNDVIGGLLVLMLLGFLLGKLGQTIPILNKIGGTAISAYSCPRPW